MKAESEVVAHVIILDIQGGKQEEVGVEEWAALGKVITPLKGKIQKDDKIRFRFKRFNFKGNAEPMVVQKGKEYVVFLKKEAGGIRFPSDKKLEVAYSLIDHWTGVLPYSKFLVERLFRIESKKSPTKSFGIVAFIQGSGTLWTLNEDNYVFVRDKEVIWWGSAAEWKKHTLGGKKLPSPRDVTKAPNPEKHHREFWQARVEQIKLGMTRAEVEKLLPPHPLTGKNVGFTGGAYEIHYWVDDNWKVNIGYDYAGDDRDENGRGPGNKVLTLPKLKAEKRKVYKVKKVKGGYEIID